MNWRIVSRIVSTMSFPLAEVVLFSAWCSAQGPLLARMPITVATKPSSHMTLRMMALRRASLPGSWELGCGQRNRRLLSILLTFMMVSFYLSIHFQTSPKGNIRMSSISMTSGTMRRMACLSSCDRPDIVVSFHVVEARNPLKPHYQIGSQVDQQRNPVVPIVHDDLQIWLCLEHCSVAA
jgi:hypothetical protein